ncbi:flagellar biosynthesis protein FlhF [Alteribacillus persepolensis]|uniref:Flagellar biosynthesis protein FlhF n=1 Tax=Alteribacillus persepolensis TaxID=568899 RepID=A0A1G7YRD5_9BACI|nr:flagellar biosynthesis protein FlhF [Alteribacillus persepolensis]SDG98450.1 flagellar biosynthesis protein FlhF [Alteribacillus persepolensis]
MKVKKFTASSMPEAMEKIRKELGERAVILHSKPVHTNGVLRFLKKTKLEVIAALDEQQAGSSQPVHRTAVSPPPMKENNTHTLEKEVRELKAMIASIQQREESTKKGYPAPVQAMDQHLKEQEVAESVRLRVIKELLAKWYKSKDANDEFVKQWTKECITQLLNEASECGPSDSSKRIINLVGPTGVGKTTTMAKLAAFYQLEQSKSIAFITTDTYRIGAVEQLKTYADILNVPMKVAYSLEDFQQARQELKDRDYIFVDSAGRNFRNPLYVEELQKMIDFDEGMATYLVLSLTSRYQDMKNIYKQFSIIPIEKFIFTKIDETSYVGNLINLPAKTNIGAAYITNGQSVPDDIEAADPKKMSEWITEGDNDE